MLIRIEQNDISKRLDVFLSEKLKLSRAKITQAHDLKIIKVNHKILKLSYKLKINDLIELDENKLEELIHPNYELKEWKYELDIKYEDEYLVIINKPKEVLSHPTKFEREKTISNALIYAYGKDNLSDISGPDRLGIVHRLDKNTSGLMVAAKNNEVHKILANQIKQKTLKRKYLAIALGEFEKKEDIINKALIHYLKDDVKMTIAPDNKGLEAITKYKVLEQYKGAALVELELKTGRTHQIRAHLASINHPIFGDSLYGAKSFMRNEFYNLKTIEQLLQSYYIEFNHPILQKNIKIELKEEEFSKDFIKVLNFLRRTNGFI